MWNHLIFPAKLLFVDALRDHGGPIIGGKHQKINIKLAIITLFVVHFPLLGF